MSPPIAVVERCHKKRKTGYPGVIIREYKRKNRNVASFHLVIRFPGKSKSIYIGTENTWEERYEEVLKKGISIRKQWEVEFADNAS